MRVPTWTAQQIGRRASNASQWMVTNAESVAAGVVIVVLLTVGGYYFYKWYTRTLSDDLLDVLQDRSSVTVLMHENPDPDAMACALGIQRLAAVEDCDTRLCYPGGIRHHENRAFRAVLDLSFEEIDSADEINHEVLVVDHQQPRGFDGAEKVSPFAIVDHHQDTYTDEVEFGHIEPEIGACATLVAEYLQQQGLSFTSKADNPDVPPYITTGLLYGIMSDTQNLTQSVTERDYKAAMSLYPGADEDRLHRISSPKIDAEALEARANAVYSREVDGSFAVSDIDEVSNPDAIPQAADELVQLEGVSAVIVFAECGDVFRFSGRAYDDRVHMGAGLRSAFENIDGANAGGHSRMGGGQISKEALSEAGITKADVEERLFEAMKGER